MKHDTTQSVQSCEASPPLAHSSSEIRVTWRIVAVSSVLFLVVLWSYWPTLAELVAAWDAQPDYSHGYFVVPISLWLLWVRRGSFPRDAVKPAIYSGLAIVALTALMRYVGARFFLSAVDGWSVVLWTIGVVLALSGWRVLSWSAPSIVFLLFMIPMPFSLENMFRQPLQYLATQISCAALVVLGQPALAEANTIRIGDAQFGVAEACSGLRIFVGIVALAFVYLVVVRRSWLIKGLLLLAILPITLIANSTRIVGTCLLQLYVSSEASKRFSHDFAGFVMIPFAAVLFGLFLWYLGRLIRQVKVASVGDVIQHSAVGDLGETPSTS